MTHQIARVRALLWGCAVTVFVLMAFPSHALARDYSIDAVSIDASVAEDASLTVEEERDFDFDGLFHGVYWKIPTQGTEEHPIQVTVLSVGELIDGNYLEFEQSDSEAEKTYQLTAYDSYLRVKLFSTHSDEMGRFVIKYRVANAALRYEDTSELYWKFVSDGWDVDSRKVACTVHLPVPQGETVRPEDNVRAWGHGPLDARVDFRGNDIVYSVPDVGSSEFAEARIAFPEAWLSKASVTKGSKLDEILSEEQKWADQANAARVRARVVMFLVAAVLIIVPVGSIVIAIVQLVRYKRTHRPVFDDKYFRDVPSDDHPAVLGALLNGGDATNEGLTAALMRLTDEHYAKLEKLTYRKKGFMGREKLEEDYCLTVTSWPPEANAPSAQAIDYQTARFLFRRLAPLASSKSHSKKELYFSSIEKVAHDHPEEYSNYRDSWDSSVGSACVKRKFFVDESGVTNAPLLIAVTVNVLVGIGALFALPILEAPNTYYGLLLLVLVASAIVAVISSRFKSLSREAIELIAQLKALKRWLKDFTRLEEAIPQDVELWDRLLVMATVLGVADEVIKQLRMSNPELLESSRLSSTYGWYCVSNTIGSPARMFSSASASAHSISTAALSSSSMSSGGGGGGGFSSGGGGGFGGGGGGGAF